MRKLLLCMAVSMFTLACFAIDVKNETIDLEKPLTIEQLKKIVDFQKYSQQKSEPFYETVYEKIKKIPYKGRSIVVLLFIISLLYQELKKKEKKPKENPINFMPALIFFCINLAFDLIFILATLSGVNEFSDWVCYLYSFFYFLAVGLAIILLYKCWKALPGPFRKTTPGKAVGFLFIPFFNFYWVFISFSALAKGFYEFGCRMNDSEIKDMTNWGIACAIWFIYSCTLELFLPLIIVFAMDIAGWIIWMVFFKAMSSYANRTLPYQKEGECIVETLENGKC